MGRRFCSPATVPVSTVCGAFEWQPVKLYKPRNSLSLIWAVASRWDLPEMVRSILDWLAPTETSMSRRLIPQRVQRPRRLRNWLPVMWAQIGAEPGHPMGNHWPMCQLAEFRHEARLEFWSFARWKRMSSVKLLPL